MTRPKRRKPAPPPPANRREMWFGVALAVVSIGAIVAAVVGERTLSTARPGIGRLQWVAFALALVTGAFAVLTLVRYRPWPVAVESALENPGVGLMTIAIGVVVGAIGLAGDAVGIGVNDEFGVLQAATVTAGLLVVTLGVVISVSARRLG